MEAQEAHSTSRNTWREWLATPVGRGTLLMAGTTLAIGFAMAAQQNIVSNYFEDELGLSGSQFGYITAIREVPGFLLIFLTALFYRLSLPRLTALALLVLAVGYGFFGMSDSFWTVTPWVILSSMGYHTWLQTQSAMSMSLVRESHSGSILGRMSSVNQAGALLAMVTVFLVFQFDLLSYAAVFALCGLLAFVGAVLIFRFPNLRDGEVQSVVARREPIVFRKEYRLYYLLSVLDGARQQIFFSFGLWVLVNHFSLDVPAISAVMVAVTILGMLTGPRIGRMLDQYGERRMLKYVNIGYVVALLGYGLVDNVAVAILCYVIYSFIMPLSAMGASTYLRKIAPSEEIAPSLAMGVSMQHAAAIIVPVAAGFILNYVDYQVPFLIAVGFALLALPVTQRLRPELQKSARRLAQDLAPTRGVEAARGTAMSSGPGITPSSVPAESASAE